MKKLSKKNRQRYYDPSDESQYAVRKATPTTWAPTGSPAASTNSFTGTADNSAIIQK